MESRSVIFHVHVRKCGGSTFYHQILQRQFGRGFYRDSSLIDDVYGRAEVEQILANCPWLQAYSSHKITLDLPFRHPQATVIAIAFVRDPVERFLSQYFYLRHHPKAWDPAAQALDLGAYLQHVEQHPELQGLRQSSQLEHLTGARGQPGLERLTSYLEHPHLHLIPVEHFDAACLYFEHAYPALLSDCSYESATNRSKIDEAPTTEQREQIERLVDAADHDLFRIAQQRFQGQLDAEGLVGDELENRLVEFRSRCCERGSRHWWDWLKRKS